MFTDPRGWIMLGVMAVMESVGVFWMSRLVKVKV
jgi:tight adherence protein B